MPDMTPKSERLPRSHLPQHTAAARTIERHLIIAELVDGGKIAQNALAILASTMMSAGTAGCLANFFPTNTASNAPICASGTQ